MGSIKHNGLIIIMLFSLVLCSCVKQPKEQQRLVKQVLLTFEDTLAIGQKTQGDAASGSYFVHMDKAAQFGAGYFFKIPDSLVNKHIRVIIECKARKKHSGSGQTIVVSLQPDNTIVNLWTSLDMDVLINKKNQWVTVSDSTQITPEQNNKPGNEIRVFGFNSNQQSYLDYDDLKITYKEITYLEEK